MIIVGDFNNPPSSLERYWKQKLNRDVEKVIEIMNQMDLAVVDRLPRKRKALDSVPSSEKKNKKKKKEGKGSCLKNISN